MSPALSRPNNLLLLDALAAGRGTYYEIVEWIRGNSNSRITPEVVENLLGAALRRGDVRLRDAKGGRGAEIYELVPAQSSKLGTTSGTSIRRDEINPLNVFGKLQIAYRHLGKQISHLPFADDDQHGTLQMAQTATNDIAACISQLLEHYRGAAA